MAMAGKKTKAEATAFPAQAGVTSKGFTKQELAAVVITGGIFAGPFGKRVLMAAEKSDLAPFARAALDMFDVVLEEIHARGVR